MFFVPRINTKLKLLYVEVWSSINMVSFAYEAYIKS